MREGVIKRVAKETANQHDWLFENVPEVLNEWLIRKFYWTNHGLTVEEFLQAVEMGAGPGIADNLKVTIAP
jgi:hypothetical protein